MHRVRSLIPLLVLAGVAFAQDTNFPVGPQYLITSGSSMLMHPIATPTLSLGEAPVPTLNSTEAAAAQEVPVPVRVSPQDFLSSVFWGEHPNTETGARRITTPSLTASQAWTNVMEAANQIEAQPAGPPLPSSAGPSTEGSSVIEISSGAPSNTLPASIFDSGVTGMTDAQSLEERGYGVPLGDVAAYWKSHKPSATRVFTNRDVARLHGG